MDQQTQYARRGADGTVVVFLMLVLGVTGGSAWAENEPGLVQIGSGFTNSLYLTHAPGITDRLYVIEQGTGSSARIKNINPQNGQVTTVLTITGVRTGGERGLLGLAFHPNVANNGFLYVYTSVNRQSPMGDHDSLIRRYTLTDADTADPDSRLDILRFNQDFSNHNGGWMAFGPDGYLYIGTGDGGFANDPNNRAQNINVLLGKMLRIDIDADDFPADPDTNYAIPSGNPFVDQAGADEIWAYGLRNPWRSSFDREYGDLYIGDVGQGQFEEINFELAGSPGGLNYGWRVLEGFNCFDNSQTGGNPPCGHPSLVLPVYDYTHGFGSTQGFSVSGGYAYRGPSTNLQGKFFFADFVSNRVWSLEVDRATGQMVGGSFMDWTSTFNDSIPGSLSSIASFGEDADGNVYIVSLGGNIYRIEGNDPEPEVAAVTVPTAPGPAMSLLGILLASIGFWRMHAALPLARQRS